MVTEALVADQTDNVIETGCGLTADVVRWARWSLKAGKTCGTDGIVTEMLRDTDAADWQWKEAFNTRRMNAKEEDTIGVIADSGLGSLRRCLVAQAESADQVQSPSFDGDLAGKRQTLEPHVLHSARDLRCGVLRLPFGFPQGSACWGDVASGASEHALSKSTSPAHTTAPCGHLGFHGLQRGTAALGGCAPERGMSGPYGLEPCGMAEGTYPRQGLASAKDVQHPQ